MSVIAYRSGVMAADTGAWAGSSVHPWASKLARGLDGRLFGVAGNAAEATAFLDWVKADYRGERPNPEKTKERESSFIVLVACPTGKLSLITAFGEERYPSAPYMAIGAGAECALGALHAGASAHGAIEAALAHVEGARGFIKSITFEG